MNAITKFMAEHHQDVAGVIMFVGLLVIGLWMYYKKKSQQNQTSGVVS